MRLSQSLICYPISWDGLNEANYGYTEGDISTRDLHLFLRHHHGFRAAHRFVLGVSRSYPLNHCWISEFPANLEDDF
jgi:hypothetical protein